MSPRALLAGLSATLAVALAAPDAAAHRERYPKRLAVAIAREGVAVTIDYGVPRGELSASLRRLFDRDRSGALDDKERAQLSRQLTREATAFLELTLDGRPLALRPRTAALDAGGGEDERLSLHLELSAERALPPGDHRLRVADRHKDRRVAVPLAVTLGAGVSYRARPPLLLTVDGDRPATLELRAAK